MYRFFRGLTLVASVSDCNKHSSAILCVPVASSSLVAVDVTWELTVASSLPGFSVDDENGFGCALAENPSSTRATVFVPDDREMNPDTTHGATVGVLVCDQI